MELPYTILEISENNSSFYIDTREHLYENVHWVHLVILCCFVLPGTFGLFGFGSRIPVIFPERLRTNIPRCRRCWQFRSFCGSNLIYY
jgi:hypothetical protein